MERLALLDIDLLAEADQLPRQLRRPAAQITARLHRTEPDHGLLRIALIRFAGGHRHAHPLAAGGGGLADRHAPRSRRLEERGGQIHRPGELTRSGGGQAARDQRPGGAGQEAAHGDGVFGRVVPHLELRTGEFGHAQRDHPQAARLVGILLDEHVARQVARRRIEAPSGVGGGRHGQLRTDVVHVAAPRLGRRQGHGLQRRVGGRDLGRRHHGHQGEGAVGGSRGHKLRLAESLAESQQVLPVREHEGVAGLDLELDRARFGQHAATGRDRRRPVRPAPGQLIERRQQAAGDRLRQLRSGGDRHGQIQHGLGVIPGRGSAAATRDRQNRQHQHPACVRPAHRHLLPVFGQRHYSTNRTAADSICRPRKKTLHRD